MSLGASRQLRGAASEPEFRAWSPWTPTGGLSTRARPTRSMNQRLKLIVAAAARRARSPLANRPLRSSIVEPACDDDRSCFRLPALATDRAGVAAAEATVEGRLAVWHPITITFEGPEAAETDAAPNPFLDIRLQVAFTGPHEPAVRRAGLFRRRRPASRQGTRLARAIHSQCPGHVDTMRPSFRRDPGVAIDLQPEAGQPLDADRRDGLVRRGAARSARHRAS